MPSARLLLRGTEPVSRTVRIPRVRSVKPSVREKYTSRVVASRTSGERSATIIVGLAMRGAACVAVIAVSM